MERKVKKPTLEEVLYVPYNLNDPMENFTEK